MWTPIYRVFAYLGLMSFWASFIMGFRHAADAPITNLWFNILIYAAFIAVHISLTMPALKQAIYGSRAGTPMERQIYIIISVVTWTLLYWLHKPVPGFAYVAPVWLRYIGLCAMLLALMAFYEFASFAGLDQLLGASSAGLSHSVGSETPLMTDGPYAGVRHPMYRAAFFATFVSLLVHPNAGQLLFAAMISASFILFIPFEEHQLLKARGEEYRAYIARTPYRVFRGVW
jgi:protein-S-isoprenylcysteine O-methyltransferase Ste14